MSFEFYQGTASENTTPRITVRKGGQLVLTSGAVAMLGDDIKNVQLGYDRTGRGILFVGERHDGADDNALYFADRGTRIDDTLLDRLVWAPILPVRRMDA